MPVWGILGFTGVKEVVLTAEGWDQNLSEPALSLFSIWGASLGVSYLLWELIKGLGFDDSREMWRFPAFVGAHLHLWK